MLDPYELDAFCRVPGVTVNECRAAAGLGPHPDEEFGKITLNLPIPTTYTWSHTWPPTL